MVWKENKSGRSTLSQAVFDEAVYTEWDPSLAAVGGIALLLLAETTQLMQCLLTSCTDIFAFLHDYSEARGRAAFIPYSYFPRVNFHLWEHPTLGQLGCSRRDGWLINLPLPFVLFWSPSFGVEFGPSGQAAEGWDKQFPVHPFLFLVYVLASIKVLSRKQPASNAL